MKPCIVAMVLAAAVSNVVVGCGGSTAADTLPSAVQDAAQEAAAETSVPDAAEDAAVVPDAADQDAQLSCVADFAAEIAPAIDGLLYPSESDYPFEVVSYPDAGTGAITPAHLLELLALPGDTVVEQRTIEQFFTDYLLTGPDGAKYAQMRQVLGERMTELTVIRVGTIQVHVYVIGRTGCGEIAGLTTVSIET